MSALIRGAGGGGGKGGGGSTRTPVESPDSLRSRQYARVMDAISEGEIVGLVDGLRSVFLDDTPVQNADGSNNFSGVTLVVRTGTQAQNYIPGFPSVEAEMAVGIEITNAAPVVRSINNANANAVRVTISIPRLTNQNLTNGDTTGSTVELAIDVQTNGGGYVPYHTITISGKTTSIYQRAYRIELSGTGPWDIRLRRITADSTVSNISDKTYWSSYTEIVDAKLAYPNTALIALGVDSEQFRSIPRRGYEIKGLRVRVPSNYNPDTRAYTGAWDGTFSIAWTDNPAWCFYDLLTNDRYGLGAFIDANQIDKWTLYTIARYCDELVPNGFGQTEPRFTCNLYLQTREEAYKVINSFASIFRGMAYWSGGTITAVQDSPSNPVALFTPANVIGGQFNYSGSSIKARHTVALVAWNDPSDRYKQKIEYVEDAAGIAVNGVIQTDIVAVGCTSRGQAHRLGLWLLYTERMETEMVSFKTGLDGLSVLPGEVIQTSDPVRAGVRMGGRVTSATLTSVTLDAGVTIESGKTYTLWAVLPDGTVESRGVTNGIGAASVLTVSPAFSSAPQAYAMWVLAASDLAPESWRVISIAEAEGTQAEITALAYRGDKYAAVEQNLVLEPLQISTLNLIPSAPADLVISESLYQVTPAVSGSRITVSWNGTAFRYELKYRRSGENWQTLGTNSTSLDIHPAEPGNYEFSLVAVNSIGVLSQALAATRIILGPAGFPLADVQNLMILYQDGHTVLNWNGISDPRNIDYEVRFGAAWNTAQVIGRTPLTQFAALGNGPYWVSAHYGAVGGLNVYSTNPAEIVIAGASLTRNVIATYDEAALGWPGTISGAAAIQAGNIILGGAGNVLGIASILAEPSVLWYGGVSPAGQYDLPTGHTVNIGRVAPCNVMIGYTLRGQSIYDNVLTLSDVLGVTDWLGDTLGVKVGAQPQIALAQADGVYAAWQNFIPGTYNAQYYKARVLVTSSDPQVTAILSGLTFMVDVPDRIVDGNIQVASGGMSVVYSPAFNGGVNGNPAPMPQITILNAVAGDDVILSAQTVNGFTAQVVNAGAGVTRNINYKSQGY